METMRYDIQNCKIHLDEDRKRIKYLNDEIIIKNKELEVLKNDFKGLDIRSENIEKFNKYISQLSSCLTNKSIKINEIYENYKKIILNYSSAIRYKKFFDIYDKVEEYELENKCGINNEYFTTLLKDIENLGDFNIEKDYYSSKAIRDFNRQLNKDIDREYSDILKKNLEILKQNHDNVFSDTLVEYCNLEKIIKRFKEFYYNCTEDYKNVYGSLSLAEYIIPLLKHQMIVKDPCNENLLDTITNILITEYISDENERNIVIQSVCEKLYIPYLIYLIQNKIIQVLDVNMNNTLLFNVKSILIYFNDSNYPKFIFEFKQILLESIINNINDIIIPCIETKHKNSEKLNEIINFIKIQIDYGYEYLKQIQSYKSILGNELEEAFKILKEKIINSLQSLVDVTDNDEYKRIKTEVKSLNL